MLSQDRGRQMPDCVAPERLDPGLPAQVLRESPILRV
jgi:hypothetical protein